MPPDPCWNQPVSSFSGIDDDATGTELTLPWETEPDTLSLGVDPWANVGAGLLDPVEHFGAYGRALRWNCVTPTDPAVLRAPFPAGIRPEPYQLGPLRKELLLPRRCADTIVVAAPPGMLIQWQEEMEARFGLSFTIMDRKRVAAIRRERGWGANPWATGSLLLVSQRLLIDEAYAADLRA